MILFCVISSTRLNLFYLSIFLSNLTLYSWKTPHSIPLFRFLMSLYLAVQERMDVSFNPHPHLSCHLGHFPPSATLHFLSLPCSAPALSLFLLLWDTLWHIKCISQGNWAKLIFSEENPILYFPLETSHPALNHPWKFKIAPFHDRNSQCGPFPLSSLNLGFIISCHDGAACCDFLFKYVIMVIIFFPCFDIILVLFFFSLPSPRLVKWWSAESGEWWLWNVFFQWHWSNMKVSGLILGHHHLLVALVMMLSPKLRLRCIFQWVKVKSNTVRETKTQKI